MEKRCFSFIRSGSMFHVYGGGFGCMLALFLLAVLFLSAAPSWAADGDIDTTFGTNGKVTTAIGSGNDYAYALGIQSDGKIVVRGIQVIWSRGIQVEIILPLSVTIPMARWIQPLEQAAR